MSEAPLRIGILGAGNWARGTYLPNLRQLPGVRVVAMTSNNLEHRQKARETWGGPICFYEEPSDLLQDEVDAVIISTPNDTHEPLSIEALRAGKHVLCEKPVAFRPEGVDRIAEAQRSGGGVFQGGFELRYCDVVTRMHEQIAAGEVGAPKMLACTLIRDWGGNRGWRSDPARSGGMFAELGIHYLDLFNMLSGSDPVRVYATGGHASGEPLPDYLWCTVDYANEVRANLGLTIIAAARKEVRVHVIGTEGRLEGEILGGTVSLWRRGAAEPVDVSPERAPDTRFFGYPGSLELLRDWVGRIRSGATGDASLAQARAATVLSAAAEQSLQSGEAVRISGGAGTILSGNRHE